jgi:hypothetical protein
MAQTIYHNFKMGAASVVFNVLVWGPSISAADSTSEKRVDVKRTIEQNGHKVFFSEELIFDQKYMVPAHVQERAQLGNMHLVVCLGTDFGAMQEVQEFAQERPQQLILWIGSRGKGTYSDKGIGETMRLAGRPPIFFNHADLESCVIATASADWVEQWRYKKWGIDNQRALLDEIDPMRPGKKP